MKSLKGICLILLAAAVAATLGACGGGEGETEYGSAGSQAESAVQDRAHEEVRANMEEKLGEIGSKIDDLTQRLEDQGEEAQQELRENIDQLRARKEALGERISELGEAADQSWEEQSQQIQQSVDELASRVQRAMDELTKDQD